MGNPYDSVSVTSYNSNPPADDGSEVAANRVQWSTHKTKIGDPLKTAIEAINTSANAAFAKVLGGGGITSTATNYTVTASDQGKLVKVTASATITTPDATVVGSPFVFSIVNEHTSSITVDGSGSQTIDGSATITLAPKGGVTLNTDGTNWFTSGQNFTLPYPPGHLHGIKLTNWVDATNDIHFAAGKCRDDADTANLVLSSALIKQLDASWAAGGNAGGRSSSGLANGTWHCFVIGKTDGTTDAFFHDGLDPSAVLPSGYTLYRRVGSILRSSGAILAFQQDNDVFMLKTSVSTSYNNPGDAAVSYALTVPLGLRLNAHTIIGVADSSGSTARYVWVSDLEQSSETPGSTASFLPKTVNTGGGVSPTHAPIDVFTNTSAQIRVRIDNGTANVTLYVRTRGWTDTRGRLS